MAALAHCRDPDGGRFQRVPGGVGEEVVEHLHDAPPVGHHAGQPDGKVHDDAVPAAAAQEGAPRLLHQLGQLRRLGRNRERARVDAARIEQVADQAAHVSGLLVDDAKELAQLGRVHRVRGVQQGADRAHDGGERRAQLVAHQAQELRAHAFDLVERRQVLHGHHDRLDHTVGGMDRGRVDNRPDAASVGHREHYLLGAQRLAGAELLRDGELAQGQLAPVGAAEGQYVEDLLDWMAGGAQLLHDAPRLAVERHRMAALRVEHHDADRGGLDEGLEVGPRAPLGAVGARVGDRGRGLGGKQRQHLLVLACELLSFRLVAEEEVPDLDATVAQRRAQEGPGEDPGGVDAELADVAREVGETRRRRQVPEKLEQAQAVGRGEDLPFLLGGEAGRRSGPGAPAARRRSR